MNLAPKLDPSFDPPHTTSRFFVWFIPIFLLFFACALVGIFVFTRSHDQEIVEYALPQDSRVVSTDIPSRDSVFVPAQTMQVTESFSGHVYFNTDFGNTHLSSLIIDAIDDADVQIELAVYSIDHPLIRDALYRAAQRGVEVKLLLSEKRKAAHDLVFYNPPQNILRVDAGAEGTLGSMHHKFIIIDRNFASAKLFFGSYNFTSLQEKYDPSFVLETTRPEIIEVFGREFNRIYTGGSLAERNPYVALFNYPEGFIEIWFTPAPTNMTSVRTRFVRLITEAKKIIEVLIWNLTDSTIARAFIEKSKEGLPLTILTDDSNYSVADSAFPWLTTQKDLYTLDNLQVFTDYKRNIEIRDVFNETDINSFLHHHLLLIDRTIAAFGTNNWSTNGFFNNNESIMISDIPYITQSFKQTFDLNLDKAK